MKVTKRITKLILGILIPCLIAAGCGNVLLPTPPYAAPDINVQEPGPGIPGPDGIVHVTGISIDNPMVYLAPGGTQPLNWTIVPSNADNASVVWYSSDMAIATVDTAGIVTAVNPGLTVIKAITLDGGKEAACLVTVGGMKNVSNFRAVPGNGEAVLSWTNPSIPEFEKVSIDISPRPPGSIFPIIVNPPATGHTITGLSNGTPYTISIKSLYSDNNATGTTTVNVIPVGLVNDTILDTFVGKPGLVGAAASASTPEVIINPDTALGGTPGDGQYFGITKTWQYYTGIGTGSAAWAAHTGRFLAGGNYRVILTIAANPAFNFRGLNPASFSYTGATSVSAVFSRDYGLATVTITFPQLPGIVIKGRFSDGNDGNIPAGYGSPGIIITLNTSPLKIVESNEYGGYEIDGVPAGVYTMTAEFPGYITATVENIIVTTENYDPYVLGGTGINGILYRPVNATALAPLVVGTFTPRHGSFPNTSLNLTTNQYTAGPVQWRTLANLPVSQFEPGTAYKATFTLTATPAYTFNGMPANTFTYTGAVVTHAAGTEGSLDITVTFPVTPRDEIDVNAISGLNSLAQNLDWVIANSQAGTNYVITVTGDEALTPPPSSFLNVELNPSLENIMITLKGDRGGDERGDDLLHTIDLSGGFFTLTGFSGTQKITLVLDEHFRLQGGVRMKKFASLVMNNDCVIEGHVETGNGTFTMNGGKISSNTATNGGGVYVEGGGTFTMNGGEIRDNRATNGGGVYVEGGGTFTMKGGEIRSNRATNGGGVYVEGGGTFTMKGGEIRDNHASLGAGGDGGGVLVGDGGTFTMKGGEIRDSSAITGGGVYIKGGGTFTKSGNSAIYSNLAVMGGYGHAVAVGSGRKRNSDALAGVNMDTNKLGSLGGWE